MEGFLGEARKEGVTVVHVRSDKAVDEDGNGMGGKAWTETINATQVEVSRPNNVVDVGLKR